MAQNPFDQLAKQYLEEFLTPFGEVIRNLEVPGEAKFVDVFFAPTPPATIPQDLGLLARLLETTCCLEPFRNPPSRTEVRTCVLKLLWLQEDQRRKAKAENYKLSEAQLTQLWILATSLSQPVLEGFGGQPKTDWPSGVFFLPSHFKTAIIAIDQLPETEDTLWLRILGKGETQEQAINQVLALPADHPRRNNILRLLASWRVRIDLGELQDFAQQEPIMALPQAFLEWEQQTQTRSREEGREEGRLAAQRSLVALLLEQKLGAVSEVLSQPINLLTSTQLEALAVALLNFTSPADLEGWLTQTLRTQLVTQLDATSDSPLPISSSLRASLQSQLPTATLAFLTRLSMAIDKTLRGSGDFTALESLL
jgi:Domain of unknown function (DUF4351)